MSTDPFFRVTNLVKSYQMGATTVHALAGVDLAMPPNTFTVLMGPSGSGKSTLLYLVGGLDRATSGEIEVDGQRIDTLNENDLALYRRRTVGFIFQSFHLLPTMTALENVALPMRLAGVPKRERQERAFELLSRVGLADRAYHRPTELSGGQQQRVSVARALINDPHLILADEPTGNLDTVSGLSIMTLLSELHTAGRTVLVVTHDPRMRNFATDMIYILDGLIVDEATYTAAANFAAPGMEHA
ncbi:MAG: ABC transporter ATP-binding protein [Anaerolineae bacterium]|nr:ABC transporter ATP-binding protein [Anaerolineae bacterium]